MQNESILGVDKVSVFYNNHKAVEDVSFSMRKGAVYALIGPSGCGKSTLLRCFNRMNDSVDGFRMYGTITFNGKNICDADVSPILVRKKIGMVAQKPQPFMSSVYKNISWAPKLNGYKGDLDELVEKSLKQAALWDEVKDRLNESGLSLSGGQQQRLCIARTIAMQPEVILMDEPCAALDPVSTTKVEELISELKKDYCILIVTHNMQQAARVSDYTAFMYQGKMVEFGLTDDVFNDPKEQLTKEYIKGSFG